MVELAQCPTRDELIRMASGNLPRDQFELICGHVELCFDCQNRLSELEEPSDHFTRALTKLGRDELEKARLQMEAESRNQTAFAICNHIASKLPASDKTTTLNPPCQLGPYEVKRLIGHGGMGEVYEARHIRLDRFVALKVIRGHRQGDPLSHSHFLKEMTTSGKFDHPNLIRAYDAWEEDGTLYLVLELLDGESLQTLGSKGKVESVKDVINIMVGTCRALDYLHSNKLVHCDVKPANIMRLRSGEVKLIDFGLATNTDSAKLNSIGAGTKGYMSPEQASGSEKVEHGSDIYSAGCVLKYLLGKLPESAQKNRELDVFRKLQLIADRMTRVEPKDRYKCAGNVVDDLESLLTARQPKRGMIWSTSVAAFAFGVGLLVWKFEFKPIQSLQSYSRAEMPLNLPMTEIPAGSFLMGGVEGAVDTRVNELPRRKVEFKTPFLISTYEITVGQFRSFISATGYVTEAEKSGKGGWKASKASSWGEQSQELSWLSPGYPLAESLPVTVVSYVDAMAFCDWLSKNDGKTYRLPTEAEWEYACRAGTTDAYHFPFESRDSYCWSLWNAKETVRPRPVGLRQPNGWGLFDMCGNVREWCLDWYADKAYEEPFQTYPNGPAGGDLRVIRGGCFMDMNGFLRSSHRGYLAPNQALNNQGFRVVQLLP